MFVHTTGKVHKMHIGMNTAKMQEKNRIKFTRINNVFLLVEVMQHKLKKYLLCKQTTSIPNAQFLKILKEIIFVHESVCKWDLG